MSDPRRGREFPLGVRYDLDFEVAHGVLNTLELRNSVESTQYIDDRQRVHHRAVGRDHEVGLSALDLFDNVQTSCIRTREARQAHDVSGAIADKRLRARGETGDDGFTRAACGHRLSLFVQHFQDMGLAQEQHLAARRFVRHESDITAAEFIRDGHAEYPGYDFTLIGIQIFTCCADNLQSSQFKLDVFRFCMRGEQRDTRRIAIHANRLPTAEHLEIVIHLVGLHREGVQHQVIQHPIANRFDAIGVAQLDRRAPDIGFFFPRLDAPPAPRAHSPCGVRGLPFSSVVKNQRFTGGSARVGSVRAAGHALPRNPLAIRARVCFGHCRQRLQFFERHSA